MTSSHRTLAYAAVAMFAAALGVLANTSWQSQHLTAALTGATALIVASVACGIAAMLARGRRGTLHYFHRQRALVALQSIEGVTSPADSLLSATLGSPHLVARHLRQEGAEALARGLDMDLVCAEDAMDLLPRKARLLDRLSDVRP